MKTCLLGLVCAANQCKSSQQISNDENQKVSPFRPVPQSPPLNQRQTIDRKIPISGRSVRSQRMARNHFSALICCIRAKNAIRERHASMRVISSIFGAWKCFNPDFGQKSLEKHFEGNSYFRSVCKCLLHLYFEYQSSGTSRSIEIAIRERHAQRHV